MQAERLSRFLGKLVCSLGQKCSRQGHPPKPTQTQDGNCSQEVSVPVPIIPHGSQVSHTPNNAPMILRKGSQMVARLPQQRWPPKFCPNQRRCPGATFSGNRGGDLHLTYIQVVVSQTQVGSARFLEWMRRRTGVSAVWGPLPC